MSANHATTASFSAPKPAHTPRATRSPRVMQTFANPQRTLSGLRRTALGLAAIGVSFHGVAAAQDDSVVIEAGKVVVKPGEIIENGVIVIQGGRITAVGAQGEVEVPWELPVIGGPDHVAFPGMVEAHSSRGMDRANENIDVAPFLDVRDSLDPINVYFEDCLRWGITTVNIQQGANCVVGAKGRIVKPMGITVEEMTVRPLHGLKLSAQPKGGKSRATQSQALRTAFGDLQTYLEEIVQDARDGGDYAKREALYQGRELEGEDAEGRKMEGAAWTVDGLELIPRGAIDEKQAPLLDLVEGRRAAYFYCGAPREVHTALSVAKQNGFLGRTVLVLGNSCFKAADKIAASGVSVVLTGSLMHTERDPVTGEEIETFVPEVYAEKGITYALSSQDSSTNSLWFQALRAIGHGLDQEAALAAVTTAPAEILGLSADVGSLEAGKHGNVVLLTGDPLASDTWVDHVVIEGTHAYDRAADVRNKYVYEGEKPTGAKAGDGQN